LHHFASFTVRVSQDVVATISLVCAKRVGGIG
jgi:hypothetical protein